MRRLIRKCPRCGRYTLADQCPSCKSSTISPHPVKFSPDDKYWRLRGR